MPDIIDTILGVGAVFDWVTPLDTLIQDFTNGPSHNFYISAYDGWSVNDVRKLMKKNSVDIWGAKFLDEMIVFTVRNKDITKAQMVLQSVQLPIFGG